MIKKKVTAILVSVGMMVSAGAPTLIAHADNVNKAPITHMNTRQAMSRQMAVVQERVPVMQGAKTVGYANKYDMATILSTNGSVCNVITEFGLQGQINKSDLNIVSSGVNKQLTALNENGYVVNVTTALNVRQQPTTSSPVKFQLTENTNFKVVGQEGNWLKINVDGQSGFVFSEFTKEGTSSVGGKVINSNNGETSNGQVGNNISKANNNGSSSVASGNTVSGTSNNGSSSNASGNAVTGTSSNGSSSNVSGNNVTGTSNNGSSSNTSGNNVTGTNNNGSSSSVSGNTTSGTTPIVVPGSATNNNNKPVVKPEVKPTTPDSKPVVKPETKPEKPDSNKPEVQQKVTKTVLEVQTLCNGKEVPGATYCILGTGEYEGVNFTSTGKELVKDLSSGTITGANLTIA
ncbi:MAG: SH3 domain-containing protein, partial [Clostridium sp.]